MKTAIHIRPFAEKDWSALWSFMEPVFHAGETFPYSTDITKEEAYVFWVKLPSATFVAVDDTGDVVGTYYIKPNQPDLGAHVCNCGYVVAEHARGKGIASELCAHSQDEALALGFRAMQFNLVVSMNTHSVRAWEKNGFRIVATLPNAFHRAEQEYVDAYVMYKELTP